MFSPLSEAFIYDPIVAMTRAGLRVTVSTLLRINSGNRPFPASSVLRVPPSLHPDAYLARAFGRAGLSELDMLLWPPLRMLLAARIRRSGASLVHAHFGPDGCLVAPVARRLGLPLVVSFYGYDVSRLLHRRADAWAGRYRRLFRDSARIVGISTHITERLSQLGAPADKLRRIAAGCDLERFTYRDPAAEYRGGRVRCLHVGRLTAKKAPLQLVRAMAQAQRLLATGPALELVIVGEGELEAALRREIRLLGLNDVVRLAGALPHAAIAALMQQCHIYTQHCMTAPNGDMEGLGVTFIEAAASGLPVITSRHNGIPDIVVHGETGLLCEEGDVTAMAHHIAALARAPALWSRYGAAGRRRVEQGFTLPRTVSGYLREYAALSGCAAASSGDGVAPGRDRPLRTASG